MTVQGWKGLAIDGEAPVDLHYLSTGRCTISYSAEAIANYFLHKGWEEGKGIDPLKMQRLVYFAHGWNLVLSGRPLINEKVHTWPFGPVITSLYHALRGSGRKYIDKPVWLEDDDGKRFVPHVPKADLTACALLDGVWDAYKRFLGVRLSEMTQTPGTLWAQANERGWNLAIPDELIESYPPFSSFRSSKFTLPLDPQPPSASARRPLSSLASS